MNSSNHVEAAFRAAAERYAEVGVSVETALSQLASIAVSLHCWQGDDVGGFESPDREIGGGLAVTGNYPGRARTAAELRGDAEIAFSLIPGRHRFNLHASYAETDGVAVERNKLEPIHFQSWIDWAREQQLGLDFNPTFFGHPHADDGFTLAHQDEGIRRFWIEHGIACRKIGAEMGRALESACVTNIWIPDGFKDTPADRRGPRDRLRVALDEILSEPIDSRHLRDAVECKLFGLGSESYVVGSHEFYLGYAIANKTLLCLDAGHFHPTEVISDKISAVLCWVDELLLHVSRGVRWDSDHVVTLTDELTAITHELVRGDYLSRVHVGLDFFDASINRVAAWVIGTRSLLKAFLIAHLEPSELLRDAERSGDFTARLAWLEEAKTMPFGAVWDYYCLQQDVPVGRAWLDVVREYESRVLAARV